MPETTVGPGRVRILIPVPPLLSARRPLPTTTPVVTGEITLAFVAGSGLRIAVNSRSFHAVAQYEVGRNSAVLGVEVHPGGPVDWSIDESMQVEHWVRGVHQDAARTIIEALAAYEDAVLAHRRGAELRCPPGWEPMRVDVFEVDPLRGQRIAVALAASQRLNASVAH